MIMIIHVERAKISICLAHYWTNTERVLIQHCVNNFDQPRIFQCYYV